MTSIEHHQSKDLLALYALDAVDPDEIVVVERHLEGCAECRAELAGYHQTAASLVPAIGTVPHHIWDRILESLEGPSKAVPIAVARASRPVFPTRFMAAAAVVALVVAAGAAFAAGRLLASDSGRPTLARVAAAAAGQAGAITATLETANGDPLATIVMLEDGTGYLVDHDLPALPPDRTYQLWEVTEGGVISAGVLGAEPAVASFPAAANVRSLVITNEVSGGVPQSAGLVVASWSS